MDYLHDFVITHAHNAHIIIFFLLMLAGCNVPISEDLMLITGGMLAATVVPEHTLRMYLWIFAGCYFSDWIGYWMGYRFGPLIFEMRPFRKRRDLIEKIAVFYEKYGFYTLLFGRFIPFGVRNCLFISAGLGRMNFFRFILADGIAALITTSTLFTLGYSFGQNYDVLSSYIDQYKTVIFAVFCLAVGGFSIYFFSTKRPLT